MPKNKLNSSNYCKRCVNHGYGTAHCTEHQFGANLKLLTFFKLGSVGSEKCTTLPFTHTNHVKAANNVPTRLLWSTLKQSTAVSHHQCCPAHGNDETNSWGFFFFSLLATCSFCLGDNLIGSLSWPVLDLIHSQSAELVLSASGTEAD